MFDLKSLAYTSTTEFILESIEYIIDEMRKLDSDIGIKIVSFAVEKDFTTELHTIRVTYKERYI